MRWALQFPGLDFVVRYRSGLKNANADGLSRQAWSFSKDALMFQGESLCHDMRSLESSSAPNKKTISSTAEDSLNLTKGGCREHRHLNR